MGLISPLSLVRFQGDATKKRFESLKKPSYLCKTHDESRMFFDKD
jgi:hypothetical protein